MSTYIDRVVNDNEYPYDMLVLADAEIAQLKAELEHSFKSRDAGIIQIANLKDELEWARKQIAKADAERDALLKDAERYRWLRQFRVDSYMASGSLADLDAAIDAAMASSSKGGK